MRNLFAGSVLKKLSVDLVGRKLNVSNDGTADEAALHWQHVRVLLGVGDADVSQLKMNNSTSLVVEQIQFHNFYKNFVLIFKQEYNIKVPNMKLLTMASNAL